MTLPELGFLVLYQGDDWVEEDQESQRVSICPLTKLTCLCLPESLYIQGTCTALTLNMPSLQHLILDVSHWHDLSLLSRLSGLREVHLNGGLADARDTGLADAFGSLSQLTDLSLSKFSEFTSLGLSSSTVASLVSLRLEALPQLVALPSTSEHMTSLLMLSIDPMGSQASMNHFLAPLCDTLSASGLPSLRHLQIHNAGMETFPSSILSLRSLTRLHLRPEGDHFDRLPDGLTALQQLHDLTLFDILKLHLEVDALMLFPHLCELTIRHCRELIPSGSLFSLTQRHPMLKDIDLKGTTFSARLDDSDSDGE